MTRRPLVRRGPLRLLLVVAAAGFVAGPTALGAGAAVHPVTRVSTTTLPATTLPPVTTTAPATITTLAQASTDTTPTTRQSGTVAADPAQKRLRWIIVGLVGLAVIVLIATIWFWRSTRPGQGVTVTEVQPPPPAGPPDEEVWDQAARAVAASGDPVAALPLMAPSAPLPSVAAPGPIPSPAAPPAPLAPAAPAAPELVEPDVVDPAPAAPRASAAPAAPAASKVVEPDPPQLVAPDPPAFVEPVAPTPPAVEEPEPTAAHEAVAVAPDEDDDELEVWQPRRDPPEDDTAGGAWQGIRPLGPVRRGDGS